MRRQRCSGHGERAAICVLLSRWLRCSWEGVFEVCYALLWRRVVRRCVRRRRGARRGFRAPSFARRRPAAHARVRAADRLRPGDLHVLHWGELVRRSRRRDVGGLDVDGGNGTCSPAVAGRGGLVTVAVVRRDAGRRAEHHVGGNGSGFSGGFNGGGAGAAAATRRRGRWRHRRERRWHSCVSPAAAAAAVGRPTSGCWPAVTPARTRSRGPTPATRSSAGVARRHRRRAQAARRAVKASTGLPGRVRPAAPAAPPTPATRTGVAVVEAADCSAAAAAPRRRAAAEGRATSHPASPVRSAPAAAGHGRRSPTSGAARSSPSRSRRRPPLPAPASGRRTPQGVTTPTARASPTSRRPPRSPSTATARARPTCATASRSAPTPTPAPTAPPPTPHNWRSCARTRPRSRCGRIGDGNGWRPATSPRCRSTTSGTKSTYGDDNLHRRRWHVSRRRVQQRDRRRPHRHGHVRRAHGHCRSGRRAGHPDGAGRATGVGDGGARRGCDVHGRVARPVRQRDRRHRIDEVHGGRRCCVVHANVCTSDTVGSYVVTGTFDAFTDTADLDVVEAAPRTTAAQTTTRRRRRPRHRRRR